jgi:hypothetical protein
VCLLFDGRTVDGNQSELTRDEESVGEDEQQDADGAENVYSVSL